MGRATVVTLQRALNANLPVSIYGEGALAKRLKGGEVRRFAKDLSCQAPGGFFKIGRIRVQIDEPESGEPLDPDFLQRDIGTRWSSFGAPRVA